MRFFLIVIGLSVGLSSCGTKRKLENQPLNANEEIQIFCNQINSHVFDPNFPNDTTFTTISYCYFPEENLPYKVTVNQLIKEYLGVNWLSERTLVDAKLDDDYFSDFAQSFENEFLAAKTDWEDMFPWALEMNIDIQPNDFKNYLQCSFSNYSFTGGAHPNSQLEYHFIDKKSGKELKLKDICINLNELNKRAEPYFLKQNEIPENTDYQEYGLSFENNTFHVSNNFWFEKEYLTFFYNQYEIGPYAAGVFEISIPLSEVEELFSIKFE